MLHSCLIQFEISKKIANQQTQFNTGLGDDDPENIDVIEFAYVDAEPDCRIVYARWRIK